MHVRFTIWLLIFSAFSCSLSALTLPSLRVVEDDLDDEKELGLLDSQLPLSIPSAVVAAPPVVVASNNNVSGLAIAKPHEHHEHHEHKDSKKVKTTPQKTAAPKAKVSLPRVLFEHENIEDIESRSILAPVFEIKKRNGTLTISGKYRPELFYGRNTALFNACDPFDRTFYIRQTIDVNIDATCGSKKYDYKASELKFTFRNKGLWGNFASVAPTTEVSIKDLDAKIGPHKHVLGRHVLWVREVWLRTLLNAALDLDISHNHYLTIGYYPFKLGHGIALGDAYAVNPGLLGFYTENVVDQYAPGIVLGGELVTDALTYDLYFALFENKSESLASNSEPIYLNRYGRRKCPERGTGSINWLIAAHLEWVALDSEENGTLELEPYVLYNHAPEQKIEFAGDASSNMGTFGICADYERGNFELSFETAKNIGTQNVFGWDRNQIVRQLDGTTAAVLHVNSHVLNLDGTKALDTTANQAIINSSLQSQALNGKQISPTLKNASNRFNDPYDTPFKGWMAILDAGYWFFDRQLQVAGAVGIATGDENPNINLEDPKLTPGVGDYDGFVGLQEIYSGDRVESAFFLGQRLSRPLSFPNDAIENGLFASSATGFTNLIYAGTGLHVKPNWHRKPYWRPNLLFFWQEKSTKAFDCATKTASACKARNFLGTEINSFFNLTFADCVGLTIVAAMFIPGSHYADIKGVPLNRDQLKLLLAETPDVASQFLLGTDPAFMLNIALEYRF